MKTAITSQSSKLSVTFVLDVQFFCSLFKMPKRSSKLISNSIHKPTSHFSEVINSNWHYAFDAKLNEKQFKKQLSLTSINTEPCNLLNTNSKEKKVVFDEDFTIFQPFLNKLAHKL